jgi:hypothetical protein
VLDEHRALRKTQEGAPRVFELRRPDQHRAIDVMSLACVWVDGGAAVDQRVEEGERSLQREALGADLEDEEGCVARGLDVQGDELRLVEVRVRTDLWRVDGDLLPRHQLGCAAGLEEQPLRGCGHLASARARRAQAISSPLRARSSSTATA